MPKVGIKGYELTFFAGDFSSLASLLFDNLSTLLGVSGATIFAAFNGEALGFEIVFKRMVPACGIMLFFGNLYYAFQSARMSKQKGRLYTAQPYGLNTSGAFPFIFGILLPIANGFADCEDLTVNERIERAYQVCVASNFLTGLINIALGIAGPVILRLMPMAAFLTPIAGIGIVWLSINQIIPNFAAPFPGLLPVFMCFFGYYSGCLRKSNGETYVPEALLMVIPALIISYAWRDPVFSPDGVKAAVDGYTAGSLHFAVEDIIKGFKYMGDYLGTVIPISILASMGDVMVLVSAKKAGDPYNVRETMISDGIGTLLGAILGSPIGTVVYIGHPIHKKNGAGNGYSFMNGLIYLVFTLSGIYPIIASVVPLTATGPIIMIFGLMITEQAFEEVKRRHWPAIVFGLFFFVLDFAGAGSFEGNGGGVAGEAAGYQDGHFGKVALRQSAPLLSIIWCSIITYTIDRRWVRVIGWCLFAGVMGALGIIHQTKALVGPSLFVNGVFATAAGCMRRLGDEDNGYGLTSPMWFMLAYWLIGLVCAVALALNKAGFKGTFPDPVYEEGVDDIFDTWYDETEEKALGENAEPAGEKEQVASEAEV